jgi:hypothetical protein
MIFRWQAATRSLRKNTEKAKQATNLKLKEEYGTTGKTVRHLSSQQNACRH